MQGSPQPVTPQAAVERHAHDGVAGVDQDGGGTAAAALLAGRVASKVNGADPEHASIEKTSGTAPPQPAALAAAP